jgi:hypothetical protein
MFSDACRECVCQREHDLTQSNPTLPEERESGEDMRREGKG